MNSYLILLIIPVAFAAWLVVISKWPHAFGRNLGLTFALTAVSAASACFAGLVPLAIVSGVFGVVVLPIVPAAIADHDG